MSVGRTTAFLSDSPVLLVDDSADHAIDLEHSMPGYSVCAVTNPSDVIPMLVDGRTFAAVVLNLRIKNGMAERLVKRLKEIFGDVPIVVITGMSPSEVDSVVIRKAGAHKVLRKPFTQHDLSEALVQAISTKEVDTKFGRLEEMMASALVVDSKAMPPSSGTSKHHPPNGK